jgi:hypothetical protein
MIEQAMQDKLEVYIKKENGDIERGTASWLAYYLDCKRRAGSSAQIKLDKANASLADAATEEETRQALDAIEKAENCKNVQYRMPGSSAQNKLDKANASLADAATEEETWQALDAIEKAENCKNVQYRIPAQLGVALAGKDERMTMQERGAYIDEEGEYFEGLSVKVQESIRADRSVGNRLKAMETAKGDAQYVKATCKSCQRTVAGAISYSGAVRTPTLSHPQREGCKWADGGQHHAAIDGSRWTNVTSITKEEAAVRTRGGLGSSVNLWIVTYLH